MEEVDSGVKMAVESEVQSESMVADSKKPEAQQTLSLAQPEAAQRKGYLNSACLILYALIKLFAIDYFKTVLIF